MQQEADEINEFVTKRQVEDFFKTIWRLNIQINQAKICMRPWKIEKLFWKTFYQQRKQRNETYWTHRYTKLYFFIATN